MKRLWILGAPDPEMTAIEKLLIQNQEFFIYAKTADGRRVHAGNAYAAFDNQTMGDPETIILVECDFKIECYLAGGITKAVTIRVDHHRPGDRGYRRPPEEYMTASSVGQVIHILETECQKHVEVTDELRMTAAADHCLLAAYQGKCSQIDVERLMQYRVHQRAQFQNRSIVSVLTAINKARIALRRQQKVQIVGSDNKTYLVADFGSSTILELLEASAREGLPFLATVTDADGKRKRVFQSACAELIDGWMRSQINTLDRIYGDPVRGFAGGYIRQ